MTGTQGGKRPGAGRKPKPYRTVTLRVPAPLVQPIEKMVEEFKLTNTK